MSGLPASVDRPSATIPTPARPPADRVGADDAAKRLAHPTPRPSVFVDGIGNVGDRLLDRFKSLPMATAILEGLGQGWQKHPLRRAADAADTASRQLLDPVARRNPGAVVLIAVGSGILLAYAKPWRWLLRPTRLAGAIVQIGRYATRGPSAKAWRKAIMKGAVNASTQ